MNLGCTKTLSRWLCKCKHEESGSRQMLSFVGIGLSQFFKAMRNDAIGVIVILRDAIIAI